MFSTIEVAAKGLLNDPSWNWVFKNTFDAIEDKLNKVCKNNIRGPNLILLQTLFVISGLGILVRFISNLASGDLLCIVNDLSDNKTNLDIRSFQVENCDKKCRCYSSLSGPFHISLSAYAAQEPGCKDKVKRCQQYFLRFSTTPTFPSCRPSSTMEQCSC